MTKWKKYIFQGDSLSVTPLSYCLWATSGYSTQFSKEPVTHLMFIQSLRVRWGCNKQVFEGSRENNSLYYVVNKQFWKQKLHHILSKGWSYTPHRKMVITFLEVDV